MARDPERLKGAADLLQRYGGKMLMIPADVADAAAVDAAADQVERDLGPIAAWVNNAMSTVVAPADQITAAEYARVTATTYLSQVHGTLAALRHMKPRGRGAIIQVSSSLAIRAAPLQAAYCGAKFAVSGFTEALRSVLIADRVAVSLSVVYLPAVNTPQCGWSRKHTGRQQVAPDPVFDPRLCADAIVHAIEHLSHEVWVGRSTLMTTLAQAVAPSDADRKASKMRDAQLGEPIPEKIGDLDAPARGPAAIDGRATDRIVSTRTEFFTSRQRDAFLMAATGGVVALSALLPRLSRFRR